MKRQMLACVDDVGIDNEMIGKLRIVRAVQCAGAAQWQYHNWFLMR
jgi:hypothetical protein